MIDSPETTATSDQPPRAPAIAIGDSLRWSALAAALVACGIPLASGLALGWRPGRVAIYLILSLLYTILTQDHKLPLFLARWLCRLPVYLTVMGLLAFLLQTISRDPFVQPIAFTVPFVHAALLAPGRPSAAVGTIYLVLCALGLWLGGERIVAAIVLPVASYGALMAFMYSFVRLSVAQAEARARADQLYEQAQLSATLAERNRLARELHDTIAQGLTAVTMQLEAAERGFDRDPERARRRLHRAHELARTTLDDVRRSVWTLASPLVDAHQLSAALADHVRGFSTRTGIPASYQHDGPAPPLDHGATTQIVRILLEALHNVEKHAQAHSVTIRSCTTSDRFELSIDDDGVGFAPQAPQENGTGSGFGLLSLHERARLAGGMLEVRSAPGEGTAVVVSVPNTREN